MRGVVLLQPLLKIALASGIGKPSLLPHFLVDGGIGLALPLIAHLEEVAKLVEIIRHPQGLSRRPGSRRPLAPSEAMPSQEMMLLKGFEMGPPGLR